MPVKGGEGSGISGTLPFTSSKGQTLGTETLALNGVESKHEEAEGVKPLEIPQNPGAAVERALLPEAPLKIAYVSRVTGDVFDSMEALQKHYSECRHINENQVVITPDFQEYISGPPVAKDVLKKTYSANDELTVTSWWGEWKANKIENWKSFDVAGNSVMSVFATNAYKPCIIAGAGPSLKRNAKYLLERNQIGLVSCLHNFGYFHDLGVRPDYYMNLDAGDITIPEMSQGGAKGADYYWEASKDYTLVSALHCNPALHKKWKGKILWFDTYLGGMNDEIEAQCPGIKDFRVYFQTGGNTLGAGLYMARAVLGASPIVFVGADFSFSYDKKFHPFDSPYDQKFSGVRPCTDVFGNRVYTWGSYYGFKTWFEHQALGGLGNTPSTYINASEGGILGAYPEGNIMQIRQRRLKDVLTEYNLHAVLPSLVADKQKITMLF